jgi:hypothetical protein
VREPDFGAGEELVSGAGNSHRKKFVFNPPCADQSPFVENDEVGEVVLDGTFWRQGREQLRTKLIELITVLWRDDAEFTASQPVTGGIRTGTEPAFLGDRTVR